MMTSDTGKRTSFLIGVLLSVLDQQEFGYKDISEFRERGGFTNDTEARIAFYKLCDLFLKDGACQQPVPTPTSDHSTTHQTSHDLVGAIIQRDVEATVQHRRNAVVNDLRRIDKTSDHTLNIIPQASNSQSWDGKEAKARRRRYSSTPPWGKYSLYNPRHPRFLLSSPEHGTTSQSTSGASLPIRKRLANDELHTGDAKRPKIETSM